MEVEEGFESVEQSVLCGFHLLLFCFFLLSLLFVCHLVFNIPLHAARRAMAAALPWPLKANMG